MKTEIQMGPSFELGETHKLITVSARDFAQPYIAPYVMDWDERQFFPKELLHQAGDIFLISIHNRMIDRNARIAQHQMIATFGLKRQLNTKAC